jgi:adenylate kinase
MKRLILLGPPGCGKGTQGVMIKEYFKIPKISTGDIFRHEISIKSELGNKANFYILKGQLVPDDVTIEMVRERLKKEDCKNGFILDGFPRTIPQAEALNKMLSVNGTGIDNVIYLKVDRNEIIDRMSGRRVCEKCNAQFNIVTNPSKITGICDFCNDKLIQREDDSKETVEKRLNTYENDTYPLVEFFRKLGKLTEIEGKGSIDKIFDLILLTIKK